MANLTPDEVGALTGKDVEDVRDEEHPKGSLDDDLEGSGVDEPELDEANWDEEVRPEDREDFIAEKIKFEELTDEDRDVYLEMVSLRDEIHEGSAEEEGGKDVKNLVKRCEGIKAELMDGSRPRFLQIIVDKLKEL
jgi:hypothetical protein